MFQTSEFVYDLASNTIKRSSTHDSKFKVKSIQRLIN